MDSTQEIEGVDTLLHIETMFEASGWDDGYRDGTDMGLLEGRIFGSDKGFQFGIETGFYAGFSEMWRALADAHLPEATRVLPLKALKQLELLSETESKFPRENCADMDLQLEMDRLRGKYRTVTALLKVVEPGFRPTSNGLSF
ncbi:hypothetical protein BASA50_006197 [Batrachochytrium salamandrivorans]|uniref:Essential protein Yae1 N-terminal domain-containing protein n=1 Tax=Batrachochytrium salamandrivorans TaxID=1357716 RepID=A0ABQ8FAK4_9FUNG|nr:hypothetical protein BASA60_010562 [Batrachochytrium salamandrivorans]KAH6594935.1 hypothetical protein BASA50_006197 [Batrachochytrium salamandrivorans]KAH9267049.1 hypothetical protein BASA84_000838 [Batrachochytrium salamandrivorans]KAJ1338993.1 hypothetical protein BSLG_006132 [Batrachochytrium salamandrivorans]